MGKLPELPLEVAEKLDHVVPAIVKTSAGTSVVGSLTLNNYLAIGGFTIAVVSLLFDIWFKKRRLELMERNAKQNKSEDSEP